MSSFWEEQTIRLNTALLWAAVLLLGGLLIGVYTVNVAGQQHVIDFISFAATITSLILAVVAIVYSFFVTISNKGDADRVTSQVATLTATIHTLDRSEGRLAGGLDRLEILSEQLQELGHAVRSGADISTETRDAILTVQGVLLRQSAKSAVQSEEEEAPNLPSEQGHIQWFAARLASRATAEQCIPLFAAYKDLEEDAPYSELIAKYVLPFQTLPGVAINSNAIGEVHAYSMVFIDLDLHERANSSILVKSLLERVKEIDPNYTSALYEWKPARKFLIEQLSLEVTRLAAL